MYCDGCGATLSPGAQFCPVCRKPVAGATASPRAAGAPAAANGPAGTGPTGTTPGGIAPAAAPVDQTRIQRHLNLLAALWMANAVLRFARVGTLLIAGRVLPLFAGWGVPQQWGNFPFDFLGLGLYVLAALTALFGVAHAVFAIGLWQRQPWARPLGLVLAFIALIRIPFGTALGIYTLWVLLPEASAREYQRMCQTYQPHSQASA